MVELGFEVARERQWYDAKQTWSTIWDLTRADGSGFRVALNQYSTVQDAARMKRIFTPEPDDAGAPHLNRVAVVSCPVEGEHGENMNDLLNDVINAGLDHATK